MGVFVVFLAIILWVIANKINVNSNGDRAWDVAAALTILIPFTAMLMSGASWKYTLLLAALLFPANWLYFRISGRWDSIAGFLFLLFPGILICLLLPAIVAKWVLERL